MWTLDSSAALDLTARLAACGACVAGLETIAVRREFRAGGAFGAANVSSLRSDLVMRTSLDTVLVALLALGICSCAAVVVVGPFSPWGCAALTVGLICRFVVWRRRLLGGDGAEQLTTLTLVATWLAVIPVPSERRVEYAVMFIGAQLALSYVTAGLAKLASPIWRRGDALAGIVDTETYGHALASGMLRRSPGLSAALGWFVVAFECTFPLVLFGPPWLAVGALGLGLCFHIGCAAVMGLNTFLWAFPATYPCLLVLSVWLSAILRPAS